MEIHLARKPVRKKPTKAPDVSQVTRDSTFSRAVADRAVILDLGRDVELAFLQTGPAIVEILDHGDSEEVSLDPKLTEVTRMRMPWYGAVDTAMHILRTGISKGSVNVDAVVEALQRMDEEFKAQNPTEISDE